MADDSDARYLRLDQLAEEFQERRRRGERPTLDEYCAAHPDLAGDLRELLPALGAVESARDGFEQDAPTPLPHAKLGDFTLVRELGRGGMGIVYEAVQESLGRRVALKALTGRTFADATRRRRFEREAKAAGRLHHSNIIPVYGCGEHDGVPYFHMQLIHGAGLDAVIAEVRRFETGIAPERSAGPSNVTERIPAAEARGAADASSLSVMGLAGPPVSKRPAEYWRALARLGAQVADALEYAHGQGVVHRDIKPSNILLDAAGHAWVADFGLAKAREEENLTASGDVLGTLRYLPPEAFQGQSTPRSDIYSLGLTLWELAALRPAFAEPDQRALMQRVAEGSAPRLPAIRPDVPRDLDTILSRAIEREATARYATAGELAADLRRFLADEPIRARPVSAWESLGRWAQRNRGVAALLGVALALLALLAVTATVAAFRLRAAAAVANAERSKANARANRLALRGAQAEGEAGAVDAAMRNLALLAVSAAPDSEERLVALRNLAAWRPVLWPRVLQPAPDEYVAGMWRDEVLLAGPAGLRLVSVATGRDLIPPARWADLWPGLPAGKPAPFVQQADETLRRALLMRPAAEVGFVEALGIDLRAGKPLGKPVRLDGAVNVRRFQTPWPGGAAPAVTDDSDGFASWRELRFNGSAPSPRVALGKHLLYSRLAPLADGSLALASCPRLDPVYLPWPVAIDGTPVRFGELLVQRSRDGRSAAPAFSPHAACELPEGRGVVVAATDCTAWRLADGAPFAPCGFDLRQPAEMPVHAADGRHGATFSNDGRLRWFDLPAGRAGIGGTPPAVRVPLPLLASDDRLASFQAPGAAVFRTGLPVHESGGAVARIRRRQALERPWSAASFARGAERVFFATIAGNYLEIGQLRDARANLPIGTPLLDTAAGPFRPGTVRHFSDDGALLATVSRETGGRGIRVRLWDARTAAPLTDPVPLPSYIHSAIPVSSGLVGVGCVNGVAFVGPGDRAPRKFLRARGPWPRWAVAPDGKLAAVANRSGWGSPRAVRLIDLETLEFRGEGIPIKGDFNWMAFADARTLRLLDFAAQEAVALDVATGAATRRTFPEPLPPDLGEGAWDAGSRWGAFARHSTGEVLQLDLATGAPVGHPMRHTAPTTVVKYLRGGELLATGHSDGVVRLWDSDTGEPLGPKLPHASAPLALGETADGQLRVATADQRVREWPTPAVEGPTAEAWSEWVALRAGNGPFDAARATELDRMVGADRDAEDWQRLAADEAEEAWQPNACLRRLAPLRERFPEDWRWACRAGLLEDTLGLEAEATASFAAAVRLGGAEAVGAALLHAALDAALRPDRAAAERHLARAAPLVKDTAGFRRLRGGARGAFGDQAGALADFAAAAELARDEGPILLAAETARLRRAHAEAATILELPAPAGQEPSSERLRLTALDRMVSGDPARAEAAVRRLVALARRAPPGSQEREDAARAAVVVPGAVADWPEILAWSEAAVAARHARRAESYGATRWADALAMRAGALLRAKKLAEAAAALEELSRNPALPEAPQLAAPLHALLRIGQGDARTAGLALASMRRSLTVVPQDLELAALWQEANALLSAAGKERAPAPTGR